MNIDGQTALVTGGASGIGKAIAARLAQAGADVVVADIDRAGARRHRFLEVDLTDRAQVERMIDQAQPSILVNNAGGYSPPVFPDAPLEHWNQTMKLNLHAVMLAIHFAVPGMARRGEGAIVNIGSSAGLGLGPYPGPEYAAAKAAVVRLTASLASLAERGSGSTACARTRWGRPPFASGSPSSTLAATRCRRTWPFGSWSPTR